MEYSVTRSVSSMQSPTNHLPSENVQNYGDNGNNHSNDAGVHSPAQYGIYDEKQHYPYQSQAPSLNQLLQNNQYVPYSSLRPQVPANYQTNYWNVPRSQNETTRMYYTQYQDAYPQQINEASYSKVEKMKPSNETTSEVDQNYISDSRLYQNDDSDKSRSILQDWKLNNSKSETLSPKDNVIKSDSDKKVDKSNTMEISDNMSLKNESHLNTDYNSNTSCSEASDKNDVMYHNSNYTLENKMNQSQLKHVNHVGYENANYGQMMMHPNANYYSHMRYPSPQNNTQSYINPNNNPMMPSPINRPPMVNYPPYMQTPNPPPGYGYPPMAMHHSRAPYTVQTPYAPRGPQSPFSGHQDAYMNGSVPPLYSSGMKEPSERREDANPPNITKQEVSDSGSTSNKSATARSSKSKNAIKSESHPTTPVSNTIPSPSQTSMSSIIDENDDSVSSLGQNDSNIMHHPVSQFSQHQLPPNMSQNPSMMYPQQQPQPQQPPQPYPNNNQIPPHSMIGGYPGHMAPQQRPFAPAPNMMPGRPYHHPSDSQINNTCFQKLLELGTEPERGPWVERYLKFMQENNTPLGAVPTVVKQPLDLFRLYHAVRERGGLLSVVKTKRWKEICHIVNVNASASGAYTLRRNYIKCLLDFECRFDRNGVDPGPILQEIQSLSDKKKKSTSRTTGSSSSSTISSGPASQHNSEFGGNPTTPRPSLPPAEFTSPHQFPGHNPYNNPLHNGALMHRSPMHYPTQRSPYPGSFVGPRMMAGYNTPTGAMHQQQQQQINPQQWPSPSSSSNSNSTHPMQMPMSPGTPSNSISNSSQQSQQFGSLQEHTRRMDCKSNYGGMPPPPPPPPNGQGITRGQLPPNVSNTSAQVAIGTHPQHHSSSYPVNQAQRPLNPQLQSGMMPQNRHMQQTSASSIPDQSNFLNKPPMGAVSSTAVASNMSSAARSQLDNSRLSQSFPTSQFSYSKSSCNVLKRYDHLFPPNSVEATQPDYNKKRKYSTKDIKVFNPTTVTMALKSGLVAEVSWALNHLSIWSRDDTFYDKLTLKSLMPMFQALIDVWRNSLGMVFGYDLFIKDLELPVRLDVTTVATDGTVGRLQALLNGDDNEHDDGDVENGRSEEEHTLSMLSRGRYQSDRRGAAVRLDYGGRERDGDLAELLLRACGNEEGADGPPLLGDLWERGGADCTFHIVPPMLSQQQQRNRRQGGGDWWAEVAEGPPEIKRSRCSSPILKAPPSSPPDLEQHPLVTAVTDYDDDGDDGAESLFFEVAEGDEEKMLRCLCASIVVRNLSFVAGNDRVMGGHRGLLVLLGRLLLLGHDCCHDDHNGRSEDRWWARWTDDLREHVLVTAVNVCSHLQLDQHPDSTARPLVAGLLHWLTCTRTAAAEDALPSHRVLGCRRLCLEALMRLCVHDRNIDYVVGAGDTVVRRLFDQLATAFCCPEVQVVKEMALAVMHYLSGGGPSSEGCLYLAGARPSVVGGLIAFIEVTESQIRHVVDNMGMEALQARPELMGTSLEFLRHSGALLNRLAGLDEAVAGPLFSRDHEVRMLGLVISTVLDQTVAQSISSVLYLLGRRRRRHEPPLPSSSSSQPDQDRDQDNHHTEHGTRFRSFLTFDDLSFCDRDRDHDHDDQ